LKANKQITNIFEGRDKNCRDRVFRDEWQLETGKFFTPKLLTENQLGITTQTTSLLSQLQLHHQLTALIPNWTNTEDIKT